MNYKTLLAGVTLITALTGCGQMVEVGPTEVGKIMTKDGYQEGVIATSKFRMPPCWTYCDKLVKLEVADKQISESLTIFMPQDKLQLQVIIRGTVSINQQRSEALFGTVTPIETPNGYQIPFDTIYATYARNLIQANVREYLTRYSIAEVASSMEKVNADLREIISKELIAKTPFSVRTIGVVDVKYPTIITEAQENSAKRREQIQQEEAQLQISKVQLERQLQEARLQRQIDFEKAQGEAAAQKIQREVVDERVLELRRLENERLWIEKWSGQLPTTIMGDAVPMINLGK